MATEDQITIPEDLTSLGDEDLQALHDQAVAAFQAMLPEEGAAPEDDVLTALDALAAGVEALRAEVSERDAAALSRSNKAREIADRVLSASTEADGGAPADPEDDPAMGGDAGADEDAEPDAGADPANQDAGAAKTEAAAAGRRQTLNINLSGLRKDAPRGAPTKPDTHKVVGFAAQGAQGFDVGREMTVRDMAEAVNSRLSGFNASSYMAARGANRREQERFTIARLKREVPEGAIVNSEDPRAAFKFATDERNLPGGSLVASGGWCAPSETLYDLVDISEAANLVSTPEVQINRGGIRHTLGPDYSAVFADTGFCLTEQNDIDSDFDGNGGGVKPVTMVPCPDFTEDRLGYCGVIIGAGLLQQRGYPEVIEDYINKTLNAHAHRMSASRINSMVAGSTVISFASPQAGATAPLLTAIDAQAMHYRAVNRMADTASLEIILPTWIKAVIRSDLARRLGVDLLDVSDQRIAGWFAARRVSAQYVVDWQDIATTAASAFVAFPTSVKFLMFAAGTWVTGVSDSITLENIYDSVLLGTNDFTALFTEDPFLVAKRNHDSRVVTVPIEATGATDVGEDIAPNGTFS